MSVRVSRGFLATLGGVAITIFAWFSSSIWPAWPALAALHFVGDFLDPSSRIREAVVVLLIALNVTTWGVAIHLASSIVLRIVRSRLSSEPPGGHLHLRTSATSADGNSHPRGTADDADGRR